MEGLESVPCKAVSRAPSERDGLSQKKSALDETRVFLLTKIENQKSGVRIDVSCFLYFLNIFLPFGFSNGRRILYVCENMSPCTNNLIIESERTHNGGVGVGALQGCEPGSK